MSQLVPLFITPDNKVCKFLWLLQEPLQTEAFLSGAKESINSCTSFSFQGLMRRACNACQTADWLALRASAASLVDASGSTKKNKKRTKCSTGVPPSSPWWHQTPDHFSGHGHCHASSSGPRCDETFGHEGFFLLPAPQKSMHEVAADGGHTQPFSKGLNNELFLTWTEHD